ncbi:Transcriptional regulator [Pleurotus ostreatus]|nr:Transcriptional regulator [Pleurotus ostreatus]
MSSKLRSFSPPPPLRSSLVKSPPDAVPPTDELQLLQTELMLLKQKTMDRAKKAGEDLKALEESFRRMKEREKGKAKAIDRVKRERDYTPLLEADDSRLSNPVHSLPYKPRNTSIPLGSIPPSSTRSSLDPRRSLADDARKKKKKRKRDIDDSDVEMDPPRPRKATPPVTHIHPPKALKTTPSVSHPPSKPQPGPDFTIPPQRSLLPTRPPLPPTPVAGPSKPTEVMEDFSKLKQPAQTVVATFYTSIEPWIRPIKEEDVGFLEHTGDEVEPFIMPKLGRHYTELWEEEDMGILAMPSDADPSIFAPPDPKFEPSQLGETDVLNEEKGHGPLTERVIAALLPAPDLTWKGVKAAEDAMEGRPGGSGAAAARREKMNVTDLEARIRDTMRSNGLLDGMPDYSEKVDDPISTALRQAQRELRVVLATNKKRRERLVAIARDRLAYQEYVELRDSIDKNINSLFSKLQKKDGPKLGRKKKGKASEAAAPTPVPQKTNGNGGKPLGGISALPPCPAALGLGPDDENKLVLPEHLKQLVETRRQWVDQVGAVFEEKEREEPGRVWGVPKESVFRGIEDEVEALLLGGYGNGKKPDSPVERRQWTSSTGASGHGKGKTRADAMDVG